MSNLKWFITAGVLLVCLLVFTGCQQPSEVSEEQLSTGYYQAVLGQSGSADILGSIQTFNNEFLSQSESVVASWGEDKKGRRTWFNMVSFDEDKLTAERKYFFVIDEKVPVFLGSKRQMQFDVELLFDKEFLEKPYTSEKAKRKAVVEKVLEQFSQDIMKLRADNVKLSASGMVVNQALQVMLNLLGQSPVLAERLSNINGMDFEHPTLGEGKARMLIDGSGIVKLKIKAGYNTKDFSSQPDVIGM